MEFRASFCNPFQSQIIELGKIKESEIINRFKYILWRGYLDRISKADESKVHYSPSLEIENKENRNGLSIPAYDEKGGVKYFIFFKRPKLVTKFSGLVKTVDNDYLTEIIGQTEENAVQCLMALINN